MSKVTGRARHGAQFSDNIVTWIRLLLDAYVPPEAVILDPMGGIGKLARALPQRTILTFDLEAAYARQIPSLSPTVVANARQLPVRTAGIDAVVTSPDYGNRLADHHNNRDSSRRNGYAFWLREAGVEPHVENDGLVYWGPRYQARKTRVYLEVKRVLKTGGVFVLNVSDFIRKGEVVPAAAWHRATCERLGFDVVRDLKVPTQRLRYGANHEARVDGEHVMAMVKR